MGWKMSSVKNARPGWCHRPRVNVVLHTVRGILVRLQVKGCLNCDDNASLCQECEAWKGPFRPSWPLPQAGADDRKLQGSALGSLWKRADALSFTLPQQQPMSRHDVGQTPEDGFGFDAVTKTCQQCSSLHCRCLNP